jgi:hypothetical protein
MRVQTILAVVPWPRIASIRLGTTGGISHLICTTRLVHAGIQTRVQEADVDASRSADDSTRAVSAASSIVVVVLMQAEEASGCKLCCTERGLLRALYGRAVPAPLIAAC